jgi:hypothetical protein
VVLHPTGRGVGISTGIRRRIEAKIAKVTRGVPKLNVLRRRPDGAVELVEPAG